MQDPTNEYIEHLKEEIAWLRTENQRLSDRQPTYYPPMRTWPYDTHPTYPTKPYPIWEPYVTCDSTSSNLISDPGAKFC